MSAWEEYKKRVGSTRPWDILSTNVERATDAEESMRFSMCQDCPEFIRLTSQCKKCGCAMRLKTKLKAAACPIGKW
jgi:hypothetical protein